MSIKYFLYTKEKLCNCVTVRRHRQKFYDLQDIETVVEFILDKWSLSIENFEKYKVHLNYLNIFIVDGKLSSRKGKSIYLSQEDINNKFIIMSEINDYLSEQLMPNLPKNLRKLIVKRVMSRNEKYVK